MEFNEILKDLTPTLKKITYKLDRYSSFIDRHDLFQEASIYLWQQYSQGKLSDKTNSYILQGCYFHLRNHLRKKDRRPATISLQQFINTEDGYVGEDSLLLKDHNPKEYYYYLNNKLLCETIFNNGFTDREKELLRLFSDGFTTRQIGERLGVSHVAVVKMMSRIRIKCRQYLK